jgi:Fe-S cluster assembly iron-binding protein IscA
VTLDGEPLPFAQIVVEGFPPAHADPISGVVELDAVEEGPIQIEVTAAGCYGLQYETSERDLGEIPLTLHGDTVVIERGGSRLFIPAQSAVVDSENVIHLQHGVLWVRNTGTVDENPLRIQVGEYGLEGYSANFAVERLAGARARLYVSDGKVLVTGSSAAAMYVMMEQTLVLEDVSANPVYLAFGSGALLRAVAGSISHFEAAPTASEQFSSSILQITESLAKVLMLSAYVISFVVLPGIVIALIAISIVRRQSSDRQKSHPINRF